MWVEAFGTGKGLKKDLSRLHDAARASLDGGCYMATSVLEGKRILAVDDEPDVLTVLQEELGRDCPSCTLEKATSYEQAAEMLTKTDYDVVILDIMGVQGFDLLKISVDRGFNTVMLTANVLKPEALQKSHGMGAKAFLPKDKLGEIVPFLEDVLVHEHKPGWERLLDKLGDYFNERFGSEWKKKYPFSY
jgi:CheY-like chemotaxis protein